MPLSNLRATLPTMLRSWLLGLSWLMLLSCSVPSASSNPCEETDAGDRSYCALSVHSALTAPEGTCLTEEEIQAWEEEFGVKIVK